MTEDEMRETLSEALLVRREYWDPEELRDIVTDLLPVVRRMVADPTSPR